MMSIRNIGQRLSRDFKQTIATTILLCALPLSSTFAMTAAPDTSLNGTGYVMLDYWGDKSPELSQNNAFDALIKADGSVLMLGSAEITEEACAGDYCWDVDKTVAVLANIAADGSLQEVITTDAQFTKFGRFTSDGSKVIVMANTPFTGWPAGTLKRYNLDGTLDADFATNGVYTDSDDFLETSYPGFWFDSAGRILVTSSPRGLVRFTANGAVDTSFGSDGATGDAGNVSSVVEGTDGAYYVMMGGNISPGASLRRYSNSGVLDTGFGTDGVLDLPGAQAAEMLAMPEGGVLVLSGRLSNPFEAQLTHYSNSGAVVAQSGLLSESSATYTNFLGVGRGASLRRLEDGNILLSIDWQGATAAYQTGTFRLFGLFDAELNRVVEFDGDNGLYLAEEVIYGFNSTIPVRNAMGLDSSGRIVLAGHGLASNYYQPRWAVARLMGGHDGSTPADTTPDPFSFTPATNVALSTLVTSNSAMITGIDAAATISVSNGEYAIGCETGYTSAEGIIENNDTVCVRHTSAATHETSTTTTLTVGGVSGNFASTTLAVPNDDNTNDLGGSGKSGGGGLGLNLFAMLGLMWLLRRRQD